MPRYTHSACLVILHAIALLGCLSSTVSVIATPIPLPFALMATDYSLGLVTVNRSLPRSSIPSTGFSGSPKLVNSTRSAKRALRSSNSPGDLLETYDLASTNADKLRNLAGQSGTLDDDEFQQQYTSALSNYNDNVSDFHIALASALSDKGLANYDRTNSIETILKDFFDLNKKLFNSINDYLPTVPIVGPIVGPIFYNIKCLLDGILDQVEDCTDGTINALQPALAAILEKMQTSTCTPGIILAGLCL